MEAETLVFHRVASDYCGNPRYVVDYTNLLTNGELGQGFATGYAIARKRANTIGGTAYRGKSYRGGIVFQSYSIEAEAKDISRVTGRNFKAEKV